MSIQAPKPGERAPFEPDFPDVPAQFDPLTADHEALMRYGFPPRPLPLDPAYRPWREIAVRRSSALKSLTFGTPSFAVGYNRLDSRGHFETSRNWSGGVMAAPYRRRSFVAVFGTWRVPDIEVPTGGTAAQYACSTWIGLDGHRRGSRSLPQIGTVQSIEPGKAAEFEAWWQWWEAGPTPGPTTVKGFPVAAGDSMLASIHVWPGIGVVGNLLNLSNGAMIWPIRIVPAAALDRIRALDAECVLERPKSITAPFRNFPLPDFEETSFECWAFTQGATSSRSLRGARLIKMIHSVPNPGRIEALTSVRRDGPGSDAVSVGYRSG